MKQRATIKVTRTELFVALHTKIDGSCPFPEERPTLARCSTSSTSLCEEAQALPTSFKCLLKKGKELLHSDMQGGMYNAKIHVIRNDIFEPATQLYEGEGTLGDITISSSIPWPKNFVKMI
ncbi:hypothetical protein ACHQM5_007591 [Ranunculus cassubicifolius]